MKEENIKNEMIELVDGLDLLPRSDYNNIIMYIENNEYGEALDTLCCQIFENNIRISIHKYENIVRVGSSIGMPDSTWSFLIELIFDA